MVVAVLRRRSWQVAYVWAFMMKFKQVEKVPRLETIEEWVPHHHVAALINVKGNPGKPCSCS